VQNSKKQSPGRFDYLVVDFSFTAMLRKHCEQDGISHYDAIAIRAHLDPAYVYRLIKGEKTRPSPNTVIRLALALNLSVSQTDELLMAAGFAPLVIPRKA
jgi:transcriptional regulator with XRE-family HTH domain